MADERQPEYPRWATEDYKGAEEDFGEWLYQAQMQKEWGNGRASQLNTPGARQMAEARARFNALARTHKLQNVADRAEAWQLYQFMQHDWLHLLEYDDLRELLAGYRDDYEEGDAPWFQRDFLVRTLLPALERYGIPARDVVGIVENYSKAIEATPRLRRALQADNQEEVKAILEKVVDPQVKERTLREWLKDSKPIPLAKIPFRLYFRPDGSRFVVLDLPTTAHEALVKRQLKPILGDEEVHASIQLVSLMAGDLLDARKNKE